MIPQGGILQASPSTRQVQQPSKTYRLDLKNNRISGIADGLDAIKQMVVKCLSTERYEHFIYSFNYGTESIIGSDRLLYQSETERFIKEALMQDDRIRSVEDFVFTFEGDTGTVAFDVVTDYGRYREEVSRSV
ncbi:DUF2634 domain-containing protein [Paenibacillus sp. N1-5-1-14]|uniref:DUF2634 domain-containing protein n=1 Tax=Paenibacillus radicibacter TaxID=2972488 RepID=UPI0021592627|nr:DUF2634 domain-containing protein [Paenibacillus radicibacter]MCR8645571.1 DUF2634 domain-containing protein [Paenibacillus radicibacter]